ncbi:MliC family protein [Ruegeria arenilitoris]|uniref:MliC family protein n=1 Tax=Ruegeria arenilitoris TaxID=1173585 RepID=UPI00147F243D|nr:MliC family protein [Ruegeria arenilitoris]
MTHLRSLCLAALVGAVSGPAFAQIDILSVTFTCENGVELPVTYFNPSDGEGAAAMIVDGQLIALRQVQSGSGIRYESVNGQGTYTLRSKGWNAMVSFAAAGATDETDILKDCVSR